MGVKSVQLAAQKGYAQQEAGGDNMGCLCQLLWGSAGTKLGQQPRILRCVTAMREGPTLTEMHFLSGLGWGERCQKKVKNSG